MRILWITPWFGNYRIPVYDYLNRQTNNQFYLICNSSDLSELVKGKLTQTLGDHVSILDSEKRLVFGKGGNTTFANATLTIKSVKGLTKKIKEINPDIIIVEGFGSWAPYGIKHAWLHRKKLLMFYERTKYVERNAPWYRKLYRMIIGRTVNHFLINGMQTEEYLNDDLHFKNTPKTLGVMCADSFNLRKQVTETPIDIVKSTKERLGISKQGLTFLFVGQLVERKGIKELLAVWNNHIKKYPNDHLVVIGTGVLKEHLIKKYNSEKGIHIMGGISYDKLPLYYALSNVFIMPTLEDNWCLVLPDAMACGLPVACSIYNGGTAELIKDGVNGYSFDPLNKKSILDTLEAFHQHDLQTMGKHSIEIESNFTPDKAAQRIFDACKSVIQ